MKRKGFGSVYLGLVLEFGWNFAALKWRNECMRRLSASFGVEDAVD